MLRNIVDGNIYTNNNVDFPSIISLIKKKQATIYSLLIHPKDVLPLICKNKIKKN